MKIKTSANICIYCSAICIFVLYSFLNGQFERGQVIEYKRLSELTADRILANISNSSIEIIQTSFLFLVPAEIIGLVFGIIGIFFLLYLTEKTLIHIRLKYAALSIITFSLASDLIFECVYSIGFQFLSFLIICIGWVMGNSKRWRIIVTVASLTAHIANLPIAAGLVLSAIDKRLLLLGIIILPSITFTGHSLKIGQNNLFGLNQFFPEGYLLSNYATPNWTLHLCASGIIILAWLILKLRSKKHRDIERLIRIHEVLITTVTIGWFFSLWIGNFHRYNLPAYVIFCCVWIALVMSYLYEPNRCISNYRDSSSSTS